MHAHAEEARELKGRGGRRRRWEKFIHNEHAERKDMSKTEEIPTMSLSLSVCLPTVNVWHVHAQFAYATYKYQPTCPNPEPKSTQTVSKFPASLKTSICLLSEGMERMRESRSCKKALFSCLSFSFLRG